MSQIRKVQECQNELISIRDHLNSNNFQPNGQETLGVLNLNEFMNDLALSSILSLVKSNEFIRLCEFSFKDKLTNLKQFETVLELMIFIRNAMDMRIN